VADGHIVEEISGDRKLVREYDAAGQLVRIRVLPLTHGATPDLPPVAPTPRPPPADEAPKQRGGIFSRKTSPPNAPPPTGSPPAEPTPAPPPVAPAPAPADAPTPSPPPARPVHVRFADEAPRAGTIDVIVEPVLAPIVFATPEPAAAPEPTPEQVPLAFVEPEPLPDAQPAPLEATPAPPPRRSTFHIVAVEPLAPPPAAPPEPAVEPEPQPTPEPRPQPPASYVALVPDVDERVDAVLAREDAPAKRRKRAPIPAPAFEPLTREPWEERLDAALAR